MMFKKLFIVIVVVVCLPFAKHYSQTARIGKFGAAAGFSPMWMFPDVNSINIELEKFGVPKLAEKGLFVWGGGAYAYVLFAENMRFGFYGYGGSTSESKATNNFNKEASYSISGWAITVEYTLPFIKNVSLSPGVMIGRSGIDLNVYKNNGDFNWTGIWDEFNSYNSSSNFSRSIYNSYWTISPTLNFEVPLNRFVSLRTGCGYNLNLGGEWKTENDQKLNGVPDDINGNGAFVQLGLFFGFLAF